MRALIALGLFVRLASPTLAAETAAGTETGSQQWVDLHQAGVNAYRTGAYAEALASFQDCWPKAIGQAARGMTASDIAATLHALGREAEARTWFERALEIWRALSDRPDEIARAALGLADVNRGLGDFAAAEQTVRSAIASRPSGEREAALRNRLADMMREQGKNDEARAQLARALTLAGNSPTARMDSLLGLAELDRETMRWDESIAASNQALALARRENDAYSEAIALRDLGLVHLNRGEPALAEPLLRRSLSLLEKDPGVPPQQIANALQCVATIYYEKRKYALSEEALTRGLALLKETVGDEHPHSARLMEQLAEVLAKERRYAEARRYADHAYSIMDRTFGETSFSAAEALSTVGRVKEQSGDFSGAAADYAGAIRTLRGSGATDGQALVLTMDRYAAVLQALHRKREAKQMRTEIKSFLAR